MFAENKKLIAVSTTTNFYIYWLSRVNRFTKLFGGCCSATIFCKVALRS